MKFVEEEKRVPNEQNLLKDTTRAVHTQVQNEPRVCFFLENRSFL